MRVRLRLTHDLGDPKAFRTADAALDGDGALFEPCLGRDGARRRVVHEAVAVGRESLCRDLRNVS